MTWSFFPRIWADETLSKRKECDLFSSDGPCRFEFIRKKTGASGKHRFPISGSGTRKNQKMEPRRKRVTLKRRPSGLLYQKVTKAIFPTVSSFSLAVLWHFGTQGRPTHFQHAFPAKPPTSLWQVQRLTAVKKTSVMKNVSGAHAASRHPLGMHSFWSSILAWLRNARNPQCENGNSIQNPKCSERNLFLLRAITTMEYR